MEVKIKRPANIGETIEIVNAQNSHNWYRNGDRFIVVSCFSTGSVDFKIKNGDIVLAFLSEYVVIEDRERMRDKAYPKIKEGSKFIVVDNKFYTDLDIGEIVILDINDGTDVPYFKIKGKHNQYIEWCNLSPLEYVPRSIPTDKPCPFCGYPPDIYKNKGFWIADCSHCNCVAGESYKTEQEARDAWNKRETKTKSKKVFTPEQIAEAERLTYRLLCENVWAKDNCDAVHFTAFPPGDNAHQDPEDDFYKGKPRVLCTIHKTHNHRDSDRAVCLWDEETEWNESIGKLIALCGLLKQDVPKWLQHERNN